MRYAIILITVLYLSFVGQASVLAQGLVGSELPKEILGRGHTNKEIVALNAEIDRRRTIVQVVIVLLLVSTALGIYYLRRRKRKNQII